jgi:predicted transcriptional regulator
MSLTLDNRSLLFIRNVAEFIMTTLSLKIPAKLSATLNRVAKQRKQSKSELVRVVLEQFLNGKHEEKYVKSALELAGDLVGSVNAPADLSTNPKYMQEYGK